MGAWVSGGLNIKELLDSAGERTPVSEANLAA